MIQNNLVIIAIVPVNTKEGKYKLKRRDLQGNYEYNADYTYNGDYTYKTNTKKRTAAYEQSVKCLENTEK